MEDIGNRIFILMLIFNFFILYGATLGMVLFGGALIEKEISLRTSFVVAAVIDALVVAAIAMHFTSMLWR